MARRARGYSVPWRGAQRGYTVRFRIAGTRKERSTGIKDKRAKSAADSVAREIYALALNAKPHGKRIVASSSDLVQLSADWIKALSLRPITADRYRKYALLWVDEWQSLRPMTEASLARYFTARLRQARGKTIRSERSALHGFLKWCAAEGHISAVPTLPDVPLAGGRPSPGRHRVAAPPLSSAEIEALLKALPERSERGDFPIRARLVVAYETGLRSETLSKLTVPANYTKGADVLLLREADDKEGFARPVPLSLRARRELDAILPDVGLIFGEHKLDPYVKAAAVAALPPSKAEVFTPQHLRSASITHRLEQGAPVVGVQYLVGHKHLATTSKYVRPSYEAALSAIRGTVLGDGKRKRAKKG